MFYAPTALRASAVDVKLEIFGSERLISSLGKSFQESRVLYFLDLAAFRADKMVMVGSRTVDYFFKLRRFVSKPVAPDNTCIGEKLDSVVDSGATDSEAAVGHGAADSLDVKMLVHPQHHVEYGVSLGGAAEVLCGEISVKSVDS